MDADVILNGQALELQGDAIGALNDAHEFTSRGATAGFAFHDRADQNNRYVLYAYQNKVRLYKDGVGDLFSIEDNVVTVKGSIVVKYQIEQDMISGTGTKKIRRNVEMDLLKEIQDLRTRLNRLETANGNGRPKPIGSGT